MSKMSFPTKATVIQPINAKFSTYKVGTIVNVMAMNVSARGKTFLIERTKWRGKLPLLNQCGGVSADALRFCD